MGSLRITQIRSHIGGKRNQRETLRTLGLHRISQTVIREDKPEVRGMVATVAHLVVVEAVSDSDAGE
jgi:large subunit ribosomal protein L30